MDLCTNAGIVNDALTFVTQKQKQIDSLQKIDGRITTEEATETEAISAKAETGAENDTRPTTNGVF